MRAFFSSNPGFCISAEKKEAPHYFLREKCLFVFEEIMMCLILF